MFVSLFVTSFSANGDVNEGVAAYKRGDYAAALQEWLPAAEANDPNALFNLGQLYRLGRGVTKNLETAISYYQRAAELGHASAQGNLGTMYYFGEAARRDSKQAIFWWERAARGGDPRARYMLGVEYYNGQNITRDVTIAYAWMSLAAAGGIDEAREAEAKIASTLSISDIAEGKKLAESLKNTASHADVEGDLVSQTTRQEPPSVATRTTPEGAIPSPAATLVEPQATEAPNLPEPVDLPEPAENPEPKVSPTQSEAFLIQLGACRAEEVAMENWRQIQIRHPALLDQLHPRYILTDLGPDKGSVYRLRAGPLGDYTAAQQLCQSLIESGESCFPVTP